MKKLLVVCCCSIALVCSYSSKLYAGPRTAEGLIIGSAVGAIIGAAIADSNRYDRRYYSSSPVYRSNPAPQVVYSAVPPPPPPPSQVVYVEQVIPPPPVYYWPPPPQRGYTDNRRHHFQPARNWQRW